METKRESKVMNVSKLANPIEHKYVNKFVTTNLVSSEYAKSLKELGEYSDSYSPIDVVLDNVYNRLTDKKEIICNNNIDLEALLLICNQKVLTIMDDLSNAAIIEMEDL